MLGIETETLFRLENGAISPSLTRLEQLSKIFGCPVRFFFLHERGDERNQTDTIMQVLQALPGEKRVVVKHIAEVVRVLK